MREKSVWVLWRTCVMGCRCLHVEAFVHGKIEVGDCANGRAKVRFITHGVFCCLVIVVYVYQVHVSCFGLKTCVGIVRNVCC